MSTIKWSQRGSAMIEFTIVGPVLTLLGTMILQYCLLFNAKNLLNHASFMAARAGSMDHASLDSVQIAYARALVPLYGGGTNSTELAESLAKATADLAGNVKIELLNPTKESFDDWNEAALQAKYGKRAIPNSGQSYKDPALVKTSSGQNIQDANLIKLKITQGYELKVPLASTMLQFMMKWSDAGKDDFTTALYDKRRIPIVTNVTLEMQSDPIEPDNPVSTPGMGNNGQPKDPGFTEDPATDPPICATIGCDVLGSNPSDPGGTGGGGSVCPGGTTSSTTLPADVLFDFGQSTLTVQGKQQLDQLIASAKGKTFDSVNLIGYTDPLGSATLNDQLSLARANAVKAYLQANGFPDKPITTEGRGSQDAIKQLADCPASGDAQITCLAPDRRVVINFISNQGALKNETSHIDRRGNCCHRNCGRRTRRRSASHRRKMQQELRHHRRGRAARRLELPVALRPGFACGAAADDDPGIGLLRRRRAWLRHAEPATRARTRRIRRTARGIQRR
jgi:outer membrane protein OmpA-like peptidoglycan-associated protein